MPNVAEAMPNVARAMLMWLGWLRERRFDAARSRALLARTYGGGEVGACLCLGCGGRGLRALLACGG